MNRSHPSRDIRGSTSTELDGKEIILAVTGSVAAQRASELARWLIRRGAEVYPVMTDAACRLIHPDLLEWAAGHPPVTQLTGAVEHVALAGNVPHPADLLVVYPATANTLGKAAAGIDDTPVTTFITTALGEGIPVLMVPAMHQAMYRHPGVQENLDRLRRWGVALQEPDVQEGKAKAAGPEEVGNRIISLLSGVSPAPSLQDRPVILTAGRTSAFIDPVRVITNRSSERMGCALAAAARDAGARVTLIAGDMDVPPPPGIRVIQADTARRMKEILTEELETVSEAAPLCFAAAAVNDWEPVHTEERKIPTAGTKKWTLELQPAPKIVDDLKTGFPGIFLVLFRALTGCSDEELRRDAAERLRRAGGDLILANHAETAIGSSRNRMEAVFPDGSFRSFPEDTKEILARRIIQFLGAAITTSKDESL